MIALLSSLRFRLFLLVLLTVVPALLIQFYTNRAERDYNARLIRQTVALSRDIGASNLEQLVEGGRQMLTALSEMPSIRALDGSSVSRALSRVVAANPEYAGIALSDARGNLIARSEPASGTINVSDRSWFQQTIDTRRFTVGDLVIGRAIGRPNLPFAYPVVDESERVVGVLSTALDLNWLSAYLARTELPPGSTYTVIDRNGVVVARYPHPEIWLGNNYSDRDIVRQVLAQPVGEDDLTGLDGRRLLFGFRTVPGTGDTLRLMVGIPRDVAFAEADALRTRNLALLSAVAALALLFAWFVAGAFVVHPVRRLVHTAERLQGGDLAARSNLTFEVGELGRLGASFDAMAQTLQQRQEQMDRAARQVEGLNEQLERRVALRTRELEHANHELESFSYSVSHDLRAPLRAMNGFAQMLVDEYAGVIDPEGLRRLQAIRDNATRMAQLIDDLLDLSRLNRTELNLVPIEMDHLVRDVWEEVRPSDPSYPAILEVGTLPEVQGDYMLLRQVFVNLLSNAVKFSRPKGQARIEVGVTVTNGEAVFTVTDHGVGFDMDYRHKLFGVFQRLHSLDEFDGTGVGLAIVQRIVTRHGGRVWAESRLGEGATFSFGLPVASAEEAVPAPATAPVSSVA